MEVEVVIKINDILHKEDISLRELSRRADVRHAALSELANGKRKRIEFDHIKRISEAMQITDIREIIDIKTN
ncbi:helix-turn-helix domain-containing protein [Salibacterium halotolerans]|uniref:DNA-binding transcriptional regulator, XRE family n=1 Tax=Salibacterium halotolerans TaxID=1884432 RepID=A0A1I5UWD9_9BACI|nr:helix-turn-helix transcriptional regulator [Salibacterium halotolerans]SFP99575.1 DNA-binding transcriptional regulator, XRE family [Salibacterium halotolerans]